MIFLIIEHILIDQFNYFLTPDVELNWGVISGSL